MVSPNMSKSDSKALLQVTDLVASAVGEGEEPIRIVNGLSMSIRPGEVHAIMGQNGSGKSSFSRILAGHPDYHVESGSLLYEINGKMKNLVDLDPEIRAREGVFLSFQYPTEIPGVKNSEFLRASFNAICRHQGAEELDPFDFLELAKARAQSVGVDPAFLDRDLNVDFSGGEKKKNEILQMAILSPRLGILDEIDSGLDVDALKSVAASIEKLRSKGQSLILITHYRRLLDLVRPDQVHIFVKGRVVASGGMELADRVEKSGYESFTQLVGKE